MRMTLHNMTNVLCRNMGLNIIELQHPKNMYVLFLGYCALKVSAACLV